MRHGPAAVADATAKAQAAVHGRRSRHTCGRLGPSAARHGTAALAPQGRPLGVLAAQLLSRAMICAVQESSSGRVRPLRCRPRQGARQSVRRTRRAAAAPRRRALAERLLLAPPPRHPLHVLATCSTADWPGAAAWRAAHCGPRLALLSSELPPSARCRFAAPYDRDARAFAPRVLQEKYERMLESERLKLSLAATAASSAQ